jgi:outer membrane protein OmpA-like peptidoglycan-associated protein
VHRSIPRPLAAIAVLSLAVPSGGCPGPVVVEPPKVEDAADVATCRVAKDPLNPLIVEWPGTSKVELDSTSRHGIVIVSYAGCTLKVLAGCNARGDYSFTGVTPTREAVRVSTETDLYARLPLGAASLKGELASGSELDLSYIAVGVRRTESAPAELQGDCEGATHYVSRMTVGAYALDARAAGSAGAGVDIQGAGVGAGRKESQRRIRGSGELASCEMSAPADEGAAASKGCGAILQIGLAPLRSAAPRGEVLIAAPALEPKPARTSRPPDRGGTDRDADGLTDAVDRCPDEPEDKDGFQDEDGCPDPDNDADGVPDVSDKCPSDPENKNGYQDEDGCADAPPKAAAAAAAETAWPDKLDLGGGVSFVKGRFFEFATQIGFAHNASTLEEASLKILERVSGLLLGRGKALSIEIGVHSDSMGSDEHNQKLTQARADEIKRVLVKAGVAASRIKAVGYGETQPIASNATAADRAKNRRVEIRVTGG